MKSVANNPQPTTADEIAKMTNLMIIKNFFGQKYIVTSAELKLLSKSERDDLAQMARAQMIADLG